MKYSVLFISHAPHEVHRAFAESIGARIHITPFKKFVALTKTITWTGHFYSLISVLYSLFVRVREDVLLVDGGSSIYIAAAIKLRRPKLKLMYLDGDTMFYLFHKSKAHQKWHGKLFMKMIDGAISVSEHNSSFVPDGIPKVVCTPYPSAVTKQNVERKPYGLFVGRLDPDKRIMEILAYGLSCSHFEKFVVVGDGVLRKEVERVATTNPKLVYAGYQENVSRYYSECMFLIHLQEHDPHPTVTMEAALCGCYPVISKGVGTAYLFDKRFVVSDPTDVTAINNVITYLIQHPDEATTSLQNAVHNFPTQKSSLACFTHSFDTLVRSLDRT